ncbi:Sec-independent protein translocase protein TatB [Sinirhodobacter sp. WL0062]|uniref:Sec-independent protein translocase protein TatB n=1 Tax=Rhodobacter flavimaris TaxID=2907145 RepID=A0ABS8YPZ4_9RHOB|nr:Sec-independent protein translocase protein TatB [Sinirhodobacter sp. WL0062]MCE5971962.1 Sec-independent protein translocase protein TatB [Sinirhodobacter sp. WL0062]
MFDIGWSELLLIGVVALIVVGPKDLPSMFHSLGRMTSKARSMAREFSRAMEDAARESGLDQAASGLKDIKNVASKKSLGIDALERATEKFEKWEPKLPGTIKTPEPPRFPTDPEDLMAPTPEEMEPEPAPAKPKRAAKPKVTKTAEASAEAKPKAAKPKAKKTPAKKGDA